jgi:16S rRNA (guanine527-N7)-methyltransferase
MFSLKDNYIDEIILWNKKFNLTGLKNKDAIRSKLYDDSLNIAKAVDLNKEIKMIDIGCGAGFPGIPLKIEYPQLKITLADSMAKKIKFVQHIIDSLKLSDTEAICIRSEELAHNSKYREQYDIAVSRAVAQLNTLTEYCLPFVKAGGLFIAQKGPDIENEVKAAISAISTLGGRLKDKIKVPSGYLIVIEKIRSTSKEFPRCIGVPSKRPI